MKYIRKIALAFALLCFAVSLSGCSVTDGKRIIRIDRWYPSSLTCLVCGYKNPETKDLGMREWDCPNCKSHHDRDLNAAINIRKEGMRLISA